MKNDRIDNDDNDDNTGKNVVGVANCGVSFASGRRVFDNTHDICEVRAENVIQPQETQSTLCKP